MSKFSTSIQTAFSHLDNNLVYLDSAATTQQPATVTGAMTSFDQALRANVHRGLYSRSEQATTAFEASRDAVAGFINAARREEIAFTKNGTEAINLVARGWAAPRLKKADVIALPVSEHHSNIVPWLQVQQQTGCTIHWIELEDWLHNNTAVLNDIQPTLFACSAQSNVLGYVPDLTAWLTAAKSAGAATLVDACQAVAHRPLDVQILDCDWLVASGHKMYGPTGIGWLYGKREQLEEMEPVLGGGMMIRNVRRDGFDPADIPAKFEAGTPPIAAAIGLGAAIEWQQILDWSERQTHESELLTYTKEKLQQIDGLKLLIDEKYSTSGCLSFTVAGLHPHDVADICGQQQVCLRAGHHCCQPLHDTLGVPASLRLSLGLHNKQSDIDAAVAALQTAVDTLRI